MLPHHRALLAVAVILVSAVLVTRVARTDTQSHGFHRPRRHGASRNADFDFVLNNIKAENIRDNLRYLTSRPHLGGTVAELLTAEWTAKLWRQQGLDDVNMVDYDVMLSYPDDVIPNMVHLLTADARSWSSTPRQPPLYAPEEGRADVPYNFNGYSAGGNVTGALVYVHYGREEDFQYLQSQGISVTDKVVLARYGKVFRANIADLSERMGAVGLILFPDPADYAPRGMDQVYPRTAMMPDSAVPFGTVKLVDGDPLTPYYPAIDSAFHIPVDEAAIPKIPVQPISYSDAQHLLNALGGPAAPTDWQGDLPLTYRTGPTNDTTSVNLDVHTHHVQTTIRNVIGVIRGSEEPDRYVLLGNHRDAWIFGAVDPSSGSAAMMELTRVLMDLHVQTGWRPRRSLVFCSWAAEEYGLVGSMEWTQQWAKQLSDRAVAYLNVDMALEGNYTLRTKSAPLLYDIIYDAAKMVPNPDPAEVAAGRETVYDTWAFRRPANDQPGKPEMLLIGSGSDYKGFQHNLGVPCLDIRYTHDNETLGEPLYHTLYETFELVDEQYDTGFGFHAAVTAMWAQIAMTVADTQLLPYSLSAYSSFITAAQRDIVVDFGPLITEKNLTLDYFLSAGREFRSAVDKFEEDLVNVDLANPPAVRDVNDRLQMVERAFIDPRGLPGRPEYNHVVFAPSESDAYSATAFAGLTDALAAIADDPTADGVEATWRQFEEHLATVTHLLHTAGAVLGSRLW